MEEKRGEALNWCVRRESCIQGREIWGVVYMYNGVKGEVYWKGE